ncbi:MAG: plasmid maintenance system killer protein [Omnitrophica WOR_2 bacterium RIFCSPHIGHO2_02_FULL_52_10]|nr:MAG: plasmid maintenance system killer protein [Omnitrophica WOR_2 bacterium RIFCSPHIGHO2_02_FULL_52_10]
MIIKFKSQATQDIYDGINSKQARAIPLPVWKVAQRKLDMINAAVNLSDLKVPPGNRLEALKGDLEGFHSVRINDQYRILFRFKDSNAYDVEITDYH